MAIIIKGVDLPKEGEATLVLAIDIDETVLKMEHHEWHYTDIEAIQIPKGHGRLIDANKLEIHEIVNNPILRDFAYVYADDIEYAPTILESEEK